jgi:FKBP-type peptidyl-prolyl cis-trans isomerase
MNVLFKELFLIAVIGCFVLAAFKDGSAQNVMTTPEGLKVEILQAGNGPKAEPGKMVKVHYTGTLENGKKFDSSRDRGQPFEFQLGAGQVIRGWDQGIAMLKVGDRAKLTIPPEMGYGAAGAGGLIPPNAVLIFDVELLGVR